MKGEPLVLRGKGPVHVTDHGPPVRGSKGRPRSQSQDNANLRRAEKEKNTARALCVPMGSNQNYLKCSESLSDLTVDNINYVST